MASPGGDRMDESDDDDNSGESYNQEKSTGKRLGKVKKKKGTKFHCTGFGDCNLSFTRSEHLARHIRYFFEDRHLKSNHF